MSKGGFYSLRVYRAAEELADDVYRVISSLSPQTQYLVGSQPLRAAESIGSNLAEGYGQTDPQFRRYVRISRGSCNELQAQLRSLERRQISREFGRLRSRARDLGYSLWRLEVAITRRIEDQS